MYFAVVHKSLQNPDWKWLLAAFKGLRNGAVYGVKIRAPHALVMTALFGKGTFAKKLLVIIRATYTHSRNLGRFVFLYKFLTGLFCRMCNGRHQLHSFIAAFFIGYLVFGQNNAVNMQLNVFFLSHDVILFTHQEICGMFAITVVINLYLLSRIIVALARLAVENGLIPRPKWQVFPWFAAVVWGIVLWLFEHHQHTLQPSLQNSMTYLYHDSNTWTNLADFLLYNKLK